MGNEELKKFEKLAQDWWNVNGSMKMLHKLNPWIKIYNENFSLENKNYQTLDVRRNFN